MLNIRRKPLSLAMLVYFPIPEKLERIDFTDEIPADVFEWLKLGYIAEGMADLSGIYEPPEQALYIFDTFHIKGKHIHTFICRIQLRETDSGASVEYVEVDSDTKGKERTQFLSPFKRYGFSVAKPEDEEYQVNPRLFKSAVSSLARYIRDTTQPFIRPNYAKKPILSQTSSTPIEMLITEQQFYHLLWGYDANITDDRWFAYMEDMTLYWHSMSGEGLIDVKFKKVADGYLAYEVILFSFRLEPKLGIELTEHLMHSRIYEYEIASG